MNERDAASERALAFARALCYHRPVLPLPGNAIGAAPVPNRKGGRRRVTPYTPCP